MEFPILDGRTATFVWRGSNPPQLHADFTGWDPSAAIELERSGRGEWSHRVSLLPGTYMEYAFIRDGRRIRDPLNRTRNSINGYDQTNQFFYTGGAETTELITRVRGVPRGTITSHRVATPWFDPVPSRTIRLYRPPVAGRVPLLVAYDGQDYFRVGLATIIDNLIAQGRIAPIAVAFVPMYGDTRVLEYACNEVTVNFIVGTVLPLARAELDLVTHPRAFAMLGASMAGLQALYTALRVPDVFGNVLLQSAPLTLEVIDCVIWDMLATMRTLPRMWVSAGRYEPAGFLPDNRRLRRYLEGRGASFGYHETASGHSYPAWRDGVWRGLEWLFPPTRSARRSAAPARRRTAARRSSRGSRR